MFTRQELMEELPRLVEAPSPRIQTAEISQGGDPPEYKASIWTASGSKHDFSSGTLFWVKSSLQTQDRRGKYFLQYVEQAECSPLTESEFFRFIAEYSRRMWQPAVLRPRTGFVAALKMYCESNEAAAVAEFADDFVAFYWRTTA